MNKNMIFHMPFDEGNGSHVAYDYTPNRADGVVSGAQFTQGKFGNAISFRGNDKCDVSKSVINLQGDFTIIAWVKSHAIECGTPKQLIWMLAFSGLDNYTEVPMAVNAGSWVSIAVTRTRNGVYKFYLNEQLIHTFIDTTQLQGISLNQDFYGSDYGLGMLDDVKMFDAALSLADIIQELSEQTNIIYTLDGVDFKEYGVYVSGSDGILNRPKMKAPASLSWDNYHGESVDLMHKYYEPREITLSCFVKANSKIEFMKRIAAFESQFDKNGTNRIMVDAYHVKPLIYEVYCKNAIEISKEWDNQLMVGTFKLKLIEPEPVKKILRHMVDSTATSTVNIGFVSNKYVNIYWGDGTVTYDTLTGEPHTYTKNGDYFPVITGCIDEITGFETDAIVVWERI